MDSSCAGAPKEQARQVDAMATFNDVDANSDGMIAELEAVRAIEDEDAEGDADAGLLR